MAVGDGAADDEDNTEDVDSVVAGEGVGVEEVLIVDDGSRVDEGVGVDEDSTVDESSMVDEGVEFDEGVSVAPMADDEGTEELGVDSMLDGVASEGVADALGVESKLAEETEMEDIGVISVSVEERAVAGVVVSGSEVRIHAPSPNFTLQAYLCGVYGEKA
ncbi:unnamed protein product [Clonostachys rosea]|uniref:Uncharacterized protein n=1 Tax=Bionectria ochroleuca TaxID=29856 RepID=A0ABY6UKJ3_BIOOC|nr:unnamed protein product [Clonostachys rosea]